MHGVPLIGTSSTGLGEMITDNLKVRLDESQEEQLSVEFLADKIVYVLSAPENVWRQTSRERYERYYTLENMKSRYVNLFSNN